MARRLLLTRDKAILSHIARYRITTLEVVQKVFFEGQTTEAARSVLRRLTEAGFIQSRPLFGKKSYHQLTPQGAREFGEPEESAKPLGPQALPRAFGVLMRCCMATEPRERVRRQEFEREYCDLAEAQVAFNDFFFSQEDKARCLYRIIVDLGGDAERLVRKLFSIVQEYSRRAPLIPMIDERRFGFSVVTTSTHKEEAILIEVERFSLPASIETFVLEDLNNLLPDFYGDQ